MLQVRNLLIKSWRDWSFTSIQAGNKDLSASIKQRQKDITSKFPFQVQNKQAF